ncbi:MAG: histidinol-phosphate transaminase [Bacteriovoracales bacterium]|nr:histidinol-phosphate transaminase [Bacteriovoracales bacterium]
MKHFHRLLPPHIRSLQTYRAGKPAEELAREKNLSRISKLASNENPYGSSPLALSAMKAASKNVHRYPDTGAFALKNELATRWNLKQDNIILGDGSEGIMTYITRALLGPGDEVLTSENSFIGFSIMAKSVAADLKTVPMTDDFRFDIKALKKHLTEKTKIIYIANPNNPTGTYISVSEIDDLMSAVPKRCLVILDEAYFEFARSCPDYPDSMDYRHDNVITLRTFSKAYGLAGLRIGYGFAHEDLIDGLMKVKPPFGPNSVAQALAVAAVRDSTHLEKTVRCNLEQRERTFAFLQKIGFYPIPSVTNFIAFKAANPEGEAAMFDDLLELGVIVRPLSSHGMTGFIRVSIGTSEEMDHFISAMEEILPSWRNRFGSEM